MVLISRFVRRTCVFLSATLFFSSISVFGQSIPAKSPDPVEKGHTLFVATCSGCHGSQAQGSDHAPALVGNRRLRSRSTEQVRAVIQRGIPSNGMPAFDLPPEQLDALSEFVHSLNSAAADTIVPGDPQQGRAVFFGKGGCGSCHMVSGVGSATGPDLSSAGTSMTVSELREVLIHPGRSITPGYQLVTVSLRNGSSVHGFARGRTNFDLQLQDLNGNFHLLQSEDIASVEDEQGSVMKPFAGTAEEMQDLVAYLSHLKGQSAATEPPTTPGASDSGKGVDFTRLLHPQRGDWLTYNGRLDANRYSDLKQITSDNVGKLGLRWIFPIPHFGLESTPLVADGVMYVTGPNQAYALDAFSGRVLWRYARPRTQGLVGDASLGTNRGVALYGDNVYMVTDNAHLLALNRVTGALVWDVYMPEAPQHYGSTVAPLVVNDTILAGVSGGDWGIRGFIACFRASTGERLWRHWTIPAPGEPGRETWKGKEPLYGGGSTWLTGSYDPETDTVYWPTGNPYPDSDDKDRPGDNLFTDCILALNPHDGSLKWYFQFTPHDVHDRDANEPPVLVDTEYQGQPRKLILHADRNGFFYVLDRTSGKLLLATKFLHRVNWATGIGPDSRPILAGGEREQHSREGGCPTNAANWSSTAYSPTTRFYYVMTQEECHDQQESVPLKALDRTADSGHKYMRAINIDTGKIAWETMQFGTVLAKTWPGVLATAGGIVFYGDPNGALIAADQKKGTPLWHFATNVLMKASPMTFTVRGKQFVAITGGSDVLCFGLPD